MSKTISFVASAELVEFLEEEAEDRMTTISSTAQMLLAEKAREKTEGSEGASESPERDSEDPLEAFSDKWRKHTGSAGNYAVHVPLSVNARDAGHIRYYETEDGVRKALKRWYA